MASTALFLIEFDSVFADIDKDKVSIGEALGQGVPAGFVLQAFSGCFLAIFLENGYPHDWFGAIDSLYKSDIILADALTTGGASDNPDAC